MKINEAYNSHDHLIAKLRKTQINFSTDEHEVEYYCKIVYIPGNISTVKDCHEVINDIIFRIDNLLNYQYLDDRLVLA